MKKLAVLACLTVLIGITTTAGATDPFDTGQSRMSASEALLNMGIYAVTHPDSVKEVLEGPTAETKTKDELVMDKKVDDAIRKAWEKQE